MAQVKRIEPCAMAVVLGAGVAVYDLISGWPVRASSAAAWAVVFGLFLLAWVAFGVAVAAAWSQRRQAMNAPGPEVVARGARGLRWSSVFAIGFAVLLFTNCSSGVSTPTYAPRPQGPAALGIPSVQTGVVGAMSDAHGYWTLTAWLLVPLMVTLALPAVLATVSRFTASRRWAYASLVGVVVAAGVAFISVPFGFEFGVSACDFGTSIGACAAGVGSLANIFSIASMALFLPYVMMITGALPLPKPPVSAGVDAQSN